MELLMSDEINQRLGRIETKLEDLSDAMISLARNEEKIIAMQNILTNQTERLNRHSEKLDEVENVSLSNKQQLSNFTKLFWIIVTSVIGSYITLWMNM